MEMIKIVAITESRCIVETLDAIQSMSATVIYSPENTLMR
jgi:hypothetical protein